MPRITTGSAKNIKIKVPDIENIRLPQDIMKLALFSIITEEAVKDAKCLDLYAGSGSLGLEALSRGASWCDFVDENKKAVDTINENLKLTNLHDKAEVIQESVLRYVADTRSKYDVIFADPFYDDLKHRFLMKNLQEILNVGGFIAFLHGTDLEIESQIEGTDFTLVTQRKFGKSLVSILTH